MENINNSSGNRVEIFADTKTIRQIFIEKKKYQIPVFQRPYSWEESHIDDLLEDFEHSFSNNESEYFLGTLVFSNELEKEKGIIDVIDGQQRLTTISLIFYVFRLIFRDYKGEKWAEGRENTLREFVGLYNDDGDLISEKIVLSDINRSFYKDYIAKCWDKDEVEREKIVLEYKNKKQYNDNEIIAKAFSYIIKKLRGKDIEELKNLLSHILDKVYVVIIKAGSDSDAFTIFETLNDRGLDLCEIDLIKNRLFKLISSDSQEFRIYQKKWDDLMKKFTKPKDFQKYIEHFWISTKCNVNSKDLFQEIRKNITSLRSAKELIDSLENDFYYYNAIYDPENSDYECLDTLEKLVHMKKFNYDIVGPICLSYLRFNEPDTAKFFNSILNFFVLHISILGKRPNPEIKDKLIGEYSRKKDANAIKDILNKFGELIDFEHLENTLIKKEVNYKNHLSYFLLIKYEESHRNSEDREELSLNKRETLQVEHILPQNGDKWKDIFCEEEHIKYLNRLGNLSLLARGKQWKTSNKVFEEKKDIYRKSKINITHSLSNFDKWTSEEIEARQKDMVTKLLPLLKI